MAILWMGGEDIDFLGGINVPSVTTDNTFFRSDYARCAVYGTARYATNPFAGGTITSGWVSAQIYDNSGTYPICLIGFSNSGETFGAGIYAGIGSATATTCAILKYDGSTITVLASEVGDTYPRGAKAKVDLQVIDYGEDATVNMYVNGVLAVTYTGDIRVGTMTNMNCVSFGSDANIKVSEVMVANQDTRTLCLLTLAPNGAGDANAWDGDGSGGIDETTINDADLVYTDTADEDIQVALTDCPAGTFGVIAVGESVRACKTVDASIETLEIGFKSGGAIDVDAGRALTTAWVTYHRIATAIGGAGLTTTVLDALQLNLESET